MQLVRTFTPVSALVSNGRRVVVGVVNDLACSYDRFTGQLLRAYPGDWTCDALIDGDTLYVVAGATGAVTAFGLVDGLRRPCASIAGARGLRAWTATDGSRGLVVGSQAGTFRSFDADQRLRAEFGLQGDLAAFDVRGTTIVAAYAEAGRAGPVRAFDGLTGEELRVDLVGHEPRGHEAAIVGLHLDAAGLVTASLDGTLRAYDTAFRFIRAQTLPSYVSRLHADPGDAKVLHAIGPDVVVRLERATLAVVDSVSVKSPFAVLAVDVVGRLVGLEGGVDSLAPIPPADSSIPDVQVRYEKDGFFDKDAQGFCATWIELSQDGRTVVLRTWFDENGSTRSEQLVRGEITGVDGQQAVLAMEDGSIRRFDLATRRLV